ncbi:MAG: glucose-1-phosphate adenylyltransferase [Rhodospirillaceae bacterium]|nr:glucose-1-phosphate adenylyltransferase [Rhodospirillaceae bacterium]
MIATADAYKLAQALQGTLALVLAGGRGTRLVNLTDHEAKPAVPFGGKFRIVDFPLSNCVNSGIRRISVLTQYKAHTLLHHVQRGWGFLPGTLNEFVELWPAQQQTAAESWYRGTADAVFQNLQIIEAHAPRYILVLAGDHVYKQNYGQMLSDHLESGVKATVACVEVPREQATAFGVVGVNDDRTITEFLEKPADPPGVPGRPDKAYASMGIYLFDADYLISELRRDQEVGGSMHDFGKDIIPRIISEQRVLAHDLGRSAIRTDPKLPPYWRDVGTLDAYWEANLDLVRVTPELNLYDDHWPIWTLQEQRPSAKFVFDDEKRRGAAIDSVVSAGCVVSGSIVRKSLLFNNVRVNSYCDVEESVILPDCNIGRHCRIKKAVIGEDCRIPDGMVIGENPEEDAKRFHRTTGGVTLVTKDMLAALG